MTKLLRIPEHTRRAPVGPLAIAQASTTISLVCEMTTEEGIIDACMWQIGDICERNIKAELARVEG